MISAEQTYTFQTVAQLSEGEMVAIDSKPMPRSYDAGQGQGAIHRVSIWAGQSEPHDAWSSQSQGQV